MAADSLAGDSAATFVTGVIGSTTGPGPVGLSSNLGWRALTFEAGSSPLLRRQPWQGTPWEE